MNNNVKKQHVLIVLISFFASSSIFSGDFCKESGASSTNKSITLRRGTPIFKAKIIQNNNSEKEETQVHHFNFNNTIKIEASGLKSKKITKYSFKDIKKISFCPNETSVPKCSDISSMQKHSSSQAYIKIKIHLEKSIEEALLKLDGSIFSGYLEGTEESMVSFAIRDIDEIQILDSMGFVGENKNKKNHKK